MSRRARHRARQIRLGRTANLPATKYPSPGDNLNPASSYFDAATGSLFVGECYSVGPCRVLRYASTGVTTQYAGREYANGSVTGDGGPASAAHFGSTSEIASDSAGAAYVADRWEIRRIDPVTHIISRFAGNGNDCNTPANATVGAAANAISLHATAVAADPLSTNIWAYDSCDSRFDAISPNGVVVWQSPRVGSAGAAYHLAFDSVGRVYWLNGYRLRRMARDGTLSTVAGTGTQGDTGDGGPATSATLGAGSAVAIDAHDNVFVATNFPQRLRRIDGQGVITTLNDSSVFSGFAGDGGPLSGAQFSSVYTLSFDPQGALYVTDSNNNRIRAIRPTSANGVIDSSSTVQTYAGGVGASNFFEGIGGGNLSELCATNCDDDVDSATAEYTETQDDLAVPGRGIPLAFSRTYASSSAATSGPLGYGWTTSYTMSLEIDAASNNVVIHQENGSQLTFYPDGAGNFSGAARQLATLKANADGSYTLTRAARTSYGFDSAGRLVSEKDLNGYTTTLSYDSSGCRK